MYSTASYLLIYVVKMRLNKLCLQVPAVFVALSVESARVGAPIRDIDFDSTVIFC